MQQKLTNPAMGEKGPVDAIMPGGTTLTAVAVGGDVDVDDVP